MRCESGRRNQQTETMSNKPPVTGRVKSIKSKFENLHSLESLDIQITAATPIPSALHSHPLPANGKPYQFKRSATSIDLEKCKKTPLNVPLKNAIKTVANQSNKPSSIDESVKPLRNDVHRQSSDSFLFKNRNVVVRDKLKPLNEIKENVEVRLNRHTSDPVKRGSIKRSPAFRCGDKNAKITQKTSAIIPKGFSDKFDELLKRCVTDTQKLQEAGLTDTLKAALKQPLPAGPPPKKPPRTFESPSPKDDVDPLTLFENSLEATGKDGGTSKSPSPISPSSDLQHKINFLENQLVMTPTAKTNGHTKEKSSSNLLSCISCVSSTYDSVIVTGHANSFKATISNGQPTSLPTLNASPKTKPQPIEPIYMEPFGHLKMKSCSSTVPETKTHSNCVNNHSTSEAKPTATINSNHSENFSTSSMSCTSCPEEHHHAGENGDIHYLVSVSH